MPTLEVEIIGYASQVQGGSWTAIVSSLATAQAEAQRLRSIILPGRGAVTIYAVPVSAAPQPRVTLAADGVIVTWRTDTQVYRATYPSAATVEEASLAQFIRNVPVADNEIDALQALPALTIAWAAAQGG